MRRSLPYLAGLATCLLFLLLGLLFLRLPGAQYDEVLFVSSIHYPEWVEFSIPFRGHHIPVMLMTYIGSLKAALYAPIFLLLGAGHLTLRLPVLLLGALSIALVFLTLRRLAGNWAALAAALLLATDATYLLTTTFDWGPVAIQHLCFTAALYSFVRFSSSPRRLWLALGGFALGIALWDKAISLWLLVGFGLAALALLHRQLWQLRRALPALAAGFLLGASPFIYYNIAKPLHTFRANNDVASEGALQKLSVLDRTLDGSALQGYMVRDTPEVPPPALTGLPRLSTRVRDRLGVPTKSLQHILLVLALLAAPFLCHSTPYRKLAYLLLLGAVLSYLLMIFTRNAGGAAHHTILLWPVPHLLAGLAAGRLLSSARRATLAAFALCIFSNALILNTYYANFASYGPALIWTDAIRPLVNEVGAIQNRLVYAMDWGIAQQVLFYGNGRIGLDPAADGYLVTLDNPDSAARLRKALADPKSLFVTHTQGHEIYPDIRSKLFTFASAHGFSPSLLKTIPDSKGIPLFEIYEFRK